MSRGLSTRHAAGLVVGFVTGFWLLPPVAAVDCSARPLAPECARAEELASVLPPIPRSVRQYGIDDAALPMARSLVDEVLDHVTTGNRQRLMDAEIRIHVIPRDEDITNLPPWQPLRGAHVPDSDAGDGYSEARTYDDVRAVGPAACRAGPLDVAIGEEQIATFTDGEHRSPGPELLGRNLVHEVGHAVECGLTPAQREALAASFDTARRRPLDQVVGDYPAYSVSNQREYFAEGTAAWFGVRDSGSYRRAWLAEHDPGLHALMASVYQAPPAVATCDGQRATTVVESGGAPFTGTPGPDVIVGSSGRDVISGGGGADVICGGEGDDVLHGGFGPDRVLGGQGDDWVAGGADDDRIADDDGEDRLEGGPGNDELDARDAGDEGGPPDVVDGTEASDTCHHDPGDSTQGCPAPTPTRTPAPARTPAPPPARAP